MNKFLWNIHRSCDPRCHVAERQESGGTEIDQYMYELSASHASHVPCDEGTCGDRSSLKNSCFFQLPKLILFKVSVDTDTFFRIIT